MKTTLIAILFAFGILSCSEKKVKQIPLIEGMVTNYNHKNIFLFKDSEPEKILDTIAIRADGTFAVNKTSISTPNFYRLKFEDKGALSFFLNPSDYINFQVDANDILGSCKSNNSKFITCYWDLLRNQLAFNNEIKKLSADFSLLNDSTYNTKLYNSFYNNKKHVVAQYKKLSMEIAKRASSPIIDFVMLNQKAGNVTIFDLKADLQLFLDNAEALSLNKDLQHLFSNYDKEVMKAYNIIRSGERYGKGGKFPKLKALTNWNEEVTLQQINGKAIHVVFWTGNNLLDNEKVKQTKQLMHKNAPNGLKTLMVAYTNNRQEWLNNIKTLKLPYWHLIDTNGFNSVDLIEMGVRSFPCNFVIDGEGNILNRNVWGNELHQSINSYIKK